MPDSTDHSRRPLSLTRRHLLQRAVTLLVAAGLPACGGAGQTLRQVDPSKIKLEKRHRQTVRGTKATLVVPDTFKRVADRVWAVKQHGGVVFLLNVRRTRVPEQGAARALKRTINLVQRGGRAGLIRNEAVELGDLDGHYIEAIDLLGNNRQVLYQVVVESEDGLYIASIYAPIGLHKTHGEALGETVRSLRVVR